MKTKSKILLLMLCAVALVAASVLGTLAYLTSQDEVTNTFTVGKVAIKLDETDVDDSTPDAERDQANSYKLMPGHEYTKDPIIHVDAASEDCYLFVKVDNQIAAIEATNATVASQMATKGWVAVDGQAGVYVYIGTAGGATTAPLAVSANSNITVFEKIAIAGSVDNNTLASYKDKTITVTAYAVQKDGFESKTAAEIWSAAGFTPTPTTGA